MAVTPEPRFQTVIVRIRCFNSSGVMVDMITSGPRAQNLLSLWADMGDAVGGMCQQLRDTLRSSVFARQSYSARRFLATWRCIGRIELGCFGF